MAEKKEEDMNEDINNMIQQVLHDPEPTEKNVGSLNLQRPSSAPIQEFQTRFQQSPNLLSKGGLEPETNGIYANRLSDPNLNVHVGSLSPNMDDDLNLYAAFSHKYIPETKKKPEITNYFEALNIGNRQKDFSEQESNNIMKPGNYNNPNMTNRFRSNSNNYSIQQRNLGGNSQLQDGMRYSAEQTNYYPTNGLANQFSALSLNRHSSQNNPHPPNDMNSYFIDNNSLIQPTIASIKPQNLNYGEGGHFQLPHPHYLPNSNKKKPNPNFPPTLGRAHSYSHDSYSLNYGYANKHFGGGGQNFNGMMYNPQQGYHPQNNYYNNMNNNGYYNNNGNMNYTMNKNNKKEKQELSTLLPNLFENCKDQNGSRMIQHQIELASDEEREKILEPILPRSVDLMMDVFGNYVIQKLLEKGNEKVKRSLFNKMKTNIVTLTLHTYGCRVVQKALEVLKGQIDLQEEIIDELKNNVLKCIKDQNGNHVVQKCFETVPSSQLQFIISEVISHLDALAFHAYGCRVIQRILEFSEQEKTIDILNKLMENIMRLCNCQYGNYIMQHILEKGPEKEKNQVLEIIKKNFVELSLDKFASNVTEKSLIHSHSEFRKETLMELLKDGPNNTECGLFKMINNQYGNYVVQKLIENIDISYLENISRKFSENPEFFTEIKKSNYGKHVLSAIDKRYEVVNR